MEMMEMTMAMEMMMAAAAKRIINDDDDDDEYVDDVVCTMDDTTYDTVGKGRNRVCSDTHPRV
jgi:hypothetical protein